MLISILHDSQPYLVRFLFEVFILGNHIRHCLSLTSHIAKSEKNALKLREQSESRAFGS